MYSVRRVQSPDLSAIQPVPQLRLEEEPRRVVVLERQRDVFPNAFENEWRAERNGESPTERWQEEQDTSRATELNAWRCIRRLGVDVPAGQQDEEHAFGDDDREHWPARRHTY